jgi:hypothetical protein
MKKRTGMGWGIFAVLLLIFQESLAGVVIEQRVKDAEGKASEVVLYYSENQLRTDHREAGLTTVMDFKGDRMVMIDHRSKSFVEVKLSQWEKEVSGQLKKENPGIRPKERKITAKKTGEKAEINGFQTEKVQVFADGELIEEHWVSREIETGEVEKVMEKVARGFSKEFRSEMKEGEEIYKKLKPYGFSILVKDYTIAYGLRPIDIVEVKKIEKRELKDDSFLPPAGYVRITPKPTKK